MQVDLLRRPTEKDWIWCKTCTLNTIGKKSATLPTEEWKVKLLESEHSPIRELKFGVKMIIPYYISVHFVRHHVDVNHYVQSQRNDRQDNYDRRKAPQDEMVSHIMTMNAQSLINMSHSRLCKQASEETRGVMQEIVNQVVKQCPYMKSVLVPKCVYRNGKCTEFFPCGRSRNEKET